MLTAYCILQSEIMHTLITSYLLQSKECILPGIGILQIKNIPAAFSSDTSQILPPSEKIIFNNKSRTTSSGLTKYIAHEQGNEQQEAEKLLESFCQEWKEKINNGEELNFETIGKLHNNGKGEIIFERESGFTYFKPITIDKPYTKVEESAPDDTKPVFAEDIIANERVEEKRSYWAYWAAALFLLGATLVFLQFKDHKFSGLNTGNKSKVVIDSAGATYTRPK
jgi:nucleoid DNA-binding protein